MRRLLTAHAGVAIAVGTAVLVIAAGTLGFVTGRPQVAARPGPTPTATASAPSAAPGTATPATPGPAVTPAPAPTPLPTPACVDPATWSIARRLAQLMIVGGQFASPAVSAPAAAAGVGAFVFFGQPPAGSGPAIQSGLAEVSSAAAAAGQVAPWLSTDEEGGQVQRLGNVLGFLPSPRQMAARWTTAQVRAAMAAHASAMRSLGITMDLA